MGITCLYKIFCVWGILFCMKRSTDNHTTNNLPFAQDYLSRGWSIIPIGKDKRPVIASWMKYQSVLPTEKEITDWWTKTPDAGIAVICGKISGLIVVDIDVKDTPVADIVQGINLPPTLVAKTGGGGRHYFYQWNKKLIGAKVGIFPSVDIRSESSYIILPPSLHKSGNNYEWINEGEEIALPPDWLLKENQENDKTDWEKFFDETKNAGIRNMSATQLAGKILYEVSPEMWDTLGISFFKQWNREYNKPSLTDGELMGVWQSIMKTHLRNTKAPMLDEEEPECEEEKEIVKQFLKNKVKGTYYLAKYLTNKFNIITVGEKEREMYVYRDGYYKRAENELIYPEIQRVLNIHITKNAKSETFHKIADMTSHPRSVFYSAPIHLIPLKNGVYNQDTKELLSHSPDYRFTFQFPIMYDPQAVCPKTEAFMGEVLTPAQLCVVKQWMGYYFYRLYSFKKAIIFVGEGDTGKTTLLETILYLLGTNNVSSISLHKMTSDKFAAAHLYEKHGNVVDELSAKDISDTGNFKIATGGGSISGEYKFGNQFSFQNFSKFTFACNRIPDVADFDDEAYFNRWMVIRFENIITTKIPNFIQTLTTEEERSGLFNLAMEGLRSLLDNGGFSYGKSAIETKIEMMKSGSSIAIFTADKVAQDVGQEMSKSDMYDAYADFCAEQGLSAETMDMFGKKFLFYVSYAAEGLIYDTENPRGKRVRGWRNVRLARTPEEQARLDEFNKM